MFTLIRYVCEAVSRRASMMASAGITALLKKMDYKVKGDEGTIRVLCTARAQILWDDHNWYRDNVVNTYAASPNLHDGRSSFGYESAYGSVLEPFA